MDNRLISTIDDLPTLVKAKEVCGAYACTDVSVGFVTIKKDDSGDWVVKEKGGPWFYTHQVEAVRQFMNRVNRMALSGKDVYINRIYT